MVVTDPPYGIDFQGKAWDGRAIRQATGRSGSRRLTSGQAFQAWTTAWAEQCREAMRAGAHLAAFGAPRAAHRLASGLEDAGFELRDTLMWLYGTGMPKSRRLPDGRSTALKPAYEPIILARKPLDTSTIERNILRHRTGALNTEACRVARRHPANVVLSHHPACQAGRCHPACPTCLVDRAADRTRSRAGSLDRASRLFYCPKASRRERDAGCEHLPKQRLDLFPNAHAGGNRPRPAANAHPTVKPLALMRWLVRLLAPEGGLVLDPFCGSGSTGCAALLEHRQFIGIEREPDYVQVARVRLTHWQTIAATEPKDPADA